MGDSVPSGGPQSIRSVRSRLQDFGLIQTGAYPSKESYVIAKTATDYPARRRRRPRAERPADFLGAVRADEDAARQLASDLAALVDASLISPDSGTGELRFALAQPECDHAA